MNNILFVCSGNHGKLHHGTKSQIDSLIAQGIKINHYLIKGKGLWGYLKNISSLRRFYHKKKYDLIHVIGGHCSILCALALFNQKKVVSFLGSDIQKNTNLKDPGRFFWEMIRQSIRLFSRNYDQIIVKSKKMIQSLPKTVHKKTTVVPNGINFDTFKPMNMNQARSRLKLDSNKQYILFLGNKELKNKNIQLAYDAISILNRPEIQLLKPFPVDHQSIPLYLNASDLLILTSFSEGSPNIIKEAMACNCPIVSTDVGDVGENFSNISGYLIASNDPNDFASKIESLLTKNQRTQARTYIGHLEEGKIATKIMNIYKRIEHGH